MSYKEDYTNSRNDYANSRGGLIAGVVIEICLNPWKSGGRY